jgi:hypothetical protein
MTASATIMVKCQYSAKPTCKDEIHKNESEVWNPCQGHNSGGIIGRGLTPKVFKNEIAT